jgi:hypothetical protein
VTAVLNLLPRSEITMGFNQLYQLQCTAKKDLWPCPITRLLLVTLATFCNLGWVVFLKGSPLKYGWPFYTFSPAALPANLLFGWQQQILRCTCSAAKRLQRPCRGCHAKHIRTALLSIRPATSALFCSFACTR